MINTKTLLIIILILLMLSGLVYTWIYYQKIDSNKQQIRYRIDTVYIQIPPRAINMSNVRGKIESSGNTSEKAISYRSKLDTILVGDTISITYSYPENNFDLNISTRLDSIRTEQITSEYYIHDKQIWWESPIYLIIGFILGIFATMI